MFKKPPQCARHYQEPREIYRESAMNLPSRGTASSQRQRLQSQPRAQGFALAGASLHVISLKHPANSAGKYQAYILQTQVWESLGLQAGPEPGSGPCPGAWVLVAQTGPLFPKSGL